MWQLELTMCAEGRAWYGMEDNFSIFHSGIHFHFILLYQGKFRPEATHNLYCTFATLSILLQVVAHEGKQYGTMHLIPCLKHYRNDLP